MVCKICKKDNGWENIDCLCSSCKRKRRNKIILFSIPLLLIASIIGGLFGEIEYDFEMKKCSSMTSETSSYEFTHDVQLDANYNQKCFGLKNHPLSHIGYIFGGVLAGFFMILIPVFFITLFSEFGY